MPLPPGRTRPPPPRRKDPRAKPAARAEMLRQIAANGAARGAASADLFDMTHAARLQYQVVLSVLHGFATTICIARNLAGSHRDLDLTGLNETAGLLCARALDLRPEHGRQLVPRLRSVLEELDALLTTLAPNEETRPHHPGANHSKI